MRSDGIRRIGILAWITALFGLLVGCAATQPSIENVSRTRAEADARTPSEYVLQPDDQLDIKFFYNPELDGTLTVRPDGKISLPLMDEVQAAGRTPAQLDAFLTEQYARELRKPEITINVKTFSGRRIYVGGEVERPGLVELTGTMTPLQAVIHAGGFTENARPEAAILIRKGPRREPVPIAINLEAFQGYGKDSDYPLQGDDIVYVPKTAIAKANKFVNQYIEKLLLFRGVSLGFSYELHSDNELE